MNYRGEIDGLRALSVVLIILFHSNVTIFQGGFVGVDIFFVISGYLISTLILKDIEKKEFSILRFYERRIRRIIPCLLFIVLCSLPVSWYYFYDDELEQFAKIILYVIFFIPNIYFYLNTSYFQDLENFNFLLHTWSLGVEEQFYIIFPILFILLLKINKFFILTIVILLIFINLILVQFSGNLNLSYPFMNESFDFFNQSTFFSFYLISSRLWEFAIGILITILNKYFLKENELKSNFFSILGFFLIIFSSYFLNSLTFYPSVYTLLPTIGAFLIILYSKNTVIGYLLSFSWLRFIGKLSFSLYLWHNPVTFIINKEIEIESNFIKFIIIFIISLILSFFSWKYIENYFRYKSLSNNKNLLTYFSLTTFCILIYCLIFINSNNLAKNKYSEENIKFLNNYKGSSIATKLIEKSCLRLNNKSNFKNSCFDISETKDNIVIWGDSVAHSLSYGIRNKFEKKYNIIETTSASCVPSITLRNYGSDCYKNNKKFIDIIKTKKINIVIFSIFDHYEYLDLKKISNFLKKNNVNKIIFIGPNYYWKPSLPEYLVRNKVDISKTNKIKVNKIIFKENIILKKRLNNYPNIENINLVDLLCSKNECKYKLESIDRYNNLIIYDDNHFSIIGSKYIANEFIDLN